jgi:alanine dehydrogenase
MAKSTDKSKFSGLTEKLGLEPQTEAALIPTQEGKLFIGIPKERGFHEHRIAPTPQAVGVLVAHGHRIIVEHDAGKECGFFDFMYSEAGAEITKNTEEVFKADIILKVAPPSLFELELMHMEQTLISPIHLPTITKDYLYTLMKKRTTAIAYEFVRDMSGSFPFVRSMSEIAGSSVILIAAEYLSNANNGKGILLGGVTGVPPAKVVILGAGVVGTYATRAALGLGAQICVFDNDVNKLLRLQNQVGQRVFNSIFSPDIIAKELQDADVLIGAIHAEYGRTPVVVNESMVENMKPGSIIIDVSIDQGGCIETSEITSLDKPTYIKHDVIHYCVPNIPSRVSKTASVAFSHILYPILDKAMKTGGFKNLIQSDKGLCQGVYTFNGHLTQQHLADKFEMKYTNLNLIFSAGY